MVFVHWLTSLLMTLVSTKHSVVVYLHSFNREFGLIGICIFIYKIIDFRLRPVESRSRRRFGES